MKRIEYQISISKDEPISLSLMHYSRPPSEIKDYNTLSRDGTDTLLNSPSLPYVKGSAETTKQYFRERFAVVEALARTSLMTSPAAKRRIATRKIEIEHGYNEFQPPRDLLLYLVR